MRIKELFAIPKGEKTTDKIFAKVLISSICGILLCMCCLIGTTWAWFVQGINNGENVIQIATAPEIELKVDGQEFASGTLLQGGAHQISITHTGDQDAFAQKSTLYVTLIFGGTDAVCVQLKAENGYLRQIEAQLPDGGARSLAYEVSWFAPANAELLVENTVQIAAQEATEPTEDTAQETIEETTAPTQTQPETVPQETVQETVPQETDQETMPAQTQEETIPMETQPETTPVESESVETTVSTEPVIEEIEAVTESTEETTVTTE